MNAKSPVEHSCGLRTEEVTFQRRVTFRMRALHQAASSRSQSHVVADSAAADAAAAVYAMRSP